MIFSRGGREDKGRIHPTHTPDCSKKLWIFLSHSAPPLGEGPCRGSGATTRFALGPRSMKRLWCLLCGSSVLSPERPRAGWGRRAAACHLGGCDIIWAQRFLLSRHFRPPACGVQRLVLLSLSGKEPPPSSKKKRKVSLTWRHTPVTPVSGS